MAFGDKDPRFCSTSSARSRNDTAESFQKKVKTGVARMSGAPLDCVPLAAWCRGAATSGIDPYLVIGARLRRDPCIRVHTRCVAGQVELKPKYPGAGASRTAQRGMFVGATHASSLFARRRSGAGRGMRGTPKNAVRFFGDPDSPLRNALP